MSIFDDQLNGTIDRLKKQEHRRAEKEWQDYLDSRKSMTPEERIEELERYVFFLRRNVAGVMAENTLRHGVY